MAVRKQTSPPLPFRQAEVEDKLLQLLVSRSRALSTTEAYRSLADMFNLTMTQREARRETGKGSYWNWLVRRAMQRLQDQDWTRRAGHGRWTATESGKLVQQSREKYGTKTVTVVAHDIFAD